MRYENKSLASVINVERVSTANLDIENIRYLMEMSNLLKHLAESVVPKIEIEVHETFTRQIDLFAQTREPR